MIDDLDLSSLKRVLSTLPKQKRKGSRITDVQAAVAPIILEHCLAGRAFDADQLFAEVSEDLQIEHVHPLRLALGSGVGGRNGMDLLRGPKGFLPCLENAAKAVAVLGDAGTLSKFCEERGLTRATLADKISTLPATTDKAAELRQKLKA